nr:type I polyketide synthase [Lentzea aerocolonigenes]
MGTSRPPKGAPVVVSAKSSDALRAQIDRIRAVEADQLDLAFSAATTRAQFAHRALLIDGAEVANGVARRAGTTAFLFTGQGSQRLGMGRELYARFATFREALDEALAHLDPALKDVIWGEDEERLNQTGNTQPALFAIEVALAKLVQSLGVLPDHVAGHSIGEIAAAHIAGVLTLEDAAKLVTARANLMQALPSGGAMVSVLATEAEVAKQIGKSKKVSIAAVNGPASIVIAGDKASVAKIAKKFERTKQLTVSHAFHSPLMDPMLDDFRAAISTITFTAPRIPIATTGDVTTIDYWVNHVRDTVRFHDNVQSLGNVDTFVEIGPDGVLAAMVDGAVATQRKDRDEVSAFGLALGTLHVRGADIDWRQYFAGTGAKRIPLPTYAFQRERYWPTTTSKSTTDDWLYEVVWEKHNAPTTTDGTWLVLGDATGFAGATVTELAPGDYAGVISTTGASPFEVLNTLEANNITAPLWCVSSEPAVWGEGRVAALEQPERWGGLIRVETDTWAIPRGEQEIAFRDEGAFVPRLRRIEATTPWTPTGQILLVGAEGPMGEQLKTLPNTTDTLTDDVTAVIHLGGVDSLRELDEQLGDRELEAFVIFGSVAGTWGFRGQKQQAAHSAIVEEFARQRKARGLRATSIAYAPWEGTTDQSMTAHLRMSGLPVLDAPHALVALHHAVASGRTNVVVANVDWSTFQQSNKLFSAFQQQKPVNEPVLKQTLAKLPEYERHGALLALVREKAALVLGHNGTEAIEPDVPFRDLGFDSLTAVDLRNQIQAESGLKLSATLVFDYPTPNELAEHLLTELVGGADEVEYAVRTATDEPIAIVGMACRYPGDVRSPEDLWQLLLDGRDAIGDFPADRGWDLTSLYSGQSATRSGGFLYDVPDFDPDFFSISPREAMVMDPQQRIVLETAWEALERAGVDPATIRGSVTGVFVGGGSGEYRPSAEETGLEWQTAQSASLLSGRLAYTFGLQGPTVSIDTACSSSLVSLHLAAQALRTGECEMALAGGVCVMSTPVGFIEFSAQGALSEDGRCKAFSDNADGTGWAEGVGMLVLERLSDAVRNGHEVLAVVRGSAINSDGASNGLTAPSGPAQQRVIRQALAAAGLRPSDVDAVEAHGTGTKLGDPIEAQALLNVYGQDRSAPLLLGAVKSNIGHTQAASGVAGVIKMVMAMRAGELPRTLHAETPSSHIDWSTGAVQLLQERTSWPAVDRARRAAVSSFGASGTNAHVILEAPGSGIPPFSSVPDESAGQGAAGRSVDNFGVVPVLVSGRTPAALRDQAARLLDVDADLIDIARSAATTRASFDQRAVVLASSREELTDALAAIASDVRNPLVIRDEVARSGKLAFLFAGQGSQRLDMGRELHARFPVFAAAFDEILSHLDPSLRDVIWGDDQDTLNLTGTAQPALFAVEVALFRLAESWGLKPDFLAGHSIGEIAAAHVSGVLSLEDAAKLVTVRAKLMQALPEGGAMVAVQASEDVVLPHLTDGVAIAAVNGPDSVVIAGPEDAVVAIAERWKSKRLRVSHAFHSPLMDPMLDEFRSTVESLTFHQPRIPVVAEGDVTSAEYWVRHVREAVRFADNVRTLTERGVTTFVELGPDATLSGLVEGGIPVLRKDRDEEQSIVSALARLHVRGVKVGWAGFFGAGKAITLPTYAFQHQRFWPSTMVSTARPAAPAGDDAAFWAAVEGEDFGSLQNVLSVDTGALEQVLPALLDWRKQRNDLALIDSWRHRITWKPLDTRRSGDLNGTWLVVTAGADEWSDAVIDSLGTSVVRLDVVAADREAIAAGLRSLGTSFAGVLSLLGRADAGETSAPQGVLLTAALIQALGDAGITAPLWCVTRDGVAVNGTAFEDLTQAAIHGLGRVVTLEHPERWGGLIDLPGVIDDRVANGLTSVLSGLDGEDQVAVRSTGLFGRRLVAAPAAVPAREWRPRGTVLITGGTGALGGHVARMLAQNGAEHLVLLSRSGLKADGAAGLRAELVGLGADVTIASCDVADRKSLQAVLSAIPGPLTGVVHTAGVIDDGVLDKMTPERFEAVFRSKVTSALLLDELTSDLDAFVLFSSASSSVGSPGQSNYAAANAMLDALADRRRGQGLAATSIAWGAWGGGGMADTEDALANAKRAGIASMDPVLACEALRQLVGEGLPTAVVAAVDKGRFSGGFRPNPLLRELATESTVEAPVAEGAFREKLLGLPAAKRFDEVLELVRTRAAEVLGQADVDAVRPDRPFRDLGFDSLAVVELRNQLNAATGLSLASTLVFDHPSPEELATHVLTELIPDAAAGDSEETEIRDLLARVPLAQLREIGVLEPLMQLIGKGTAAQDDEDIDEMSVDDLIQAALDGQAD